MASVPRIAALENDGGYPGSMVFSSVVGAGLDAVTRVRMSSAGIRVRIVRPPLPFLIAVAISVAADAAPGPRRLLLDTAYGSVESHDVFFHVLARSGYGHAGGIGSHLI